jgi:segregation and condensation protein A
MGRDQLGRDVFARGDTETLRREVTVTWEASLVDLMRAYARIKTRDDFTPLHFQRGPVFAMEQALERMRGILGTRVGWHELAAWLPDDWRQEGKRRRSATAASFAAALELVKNGALEIRQEGAFAPLWLKPRHGGEDQEQRQERGEAG